MGASGGALIAFALSAKVLAALIGAVALALAWIGRILTRPAHHDFMLGSETTEEPWYMQEDRPFYDPDNWKPCANPQCQAPIPSSSRAMYCDRDCRTAAERMRRAHEFLNDPALDDIPF